MHFLDIAKFYYSFANLLTNVVFCSRDCEEGFGLFAYMRASIVLLKCNTGYPIACKNVAIWEKMFDEESRHL